ncbi:hypothetical protein GCM10017083_30740 [Thalassobaculum fulvum]|jgi:hypothetical protein|uniref:Uncharacterized protein n=1 Tax=Thalassobaculum fulvum TaxID=1633335 RepID=A0A918XTB7_9PROT|nr:hypothetical protein [Thalassobaculum fulvum]GHD53868.1 hypothetical protein GCM10017083_30740 [Thalassobaculum fulvum]
MTTNAERRARRPHRPRRYPDPIPSPDSDPVDYWEEVALARLRLAQLALVVSLAGSLIVALILG